MKIVIVGAGQMGFDLARQLDLEGHEIFVIDRDPQRIERARTRLDVMAVVGSGARLGTLKEINALGADLLIAATNSDEVNIVACLIAREAGISRRISRVKSKELVADLQDTDISVLGVDEFVNPEQVTVERLQHMVMTPETTETAEFADGRIILRALRIDKESPLAGEPLQGLHSMFTAPFLISAVRRADELIVPTGNFQLEENDVAYTIMDVATLDSFLDAFKFNRKRTGRVMIAGADRIGVDLCVAIEKRISDVILIDPDESACARAAEQVSRASVIKGSPLDQGLLEDLKVGGIDFFLGVSDSDELNLSSALLAKRLGIPRTLVLASMPEYVTLFESLPVDTVVSPVLLSVGAILRSVRKGKVHSLFKLAGTRGEALEIEVDASSAVVGKSLREISFPTGCILAAVTGDSIACIPVGNTVIHAGDRVVVVALRETCEEAVQLFSGDTSF